MSGTRDAAQERARQRVYEKARQIARKDIDRIAAEASYKSTYDIGRAMGLPQAQIWRILREEPQRIRTEEPDRITGTTIKPGDIVYDQIKPDDLVSDGYWVSCSRCDTRQRVTTNEPFVHLRNDCGDRSLKIRGPRATAEAVEPENPFIARYNELISEWAEGEKALLAEVYGEAPQAPDRWSIDPFKVACRSSLTLSICVALIVLVAGHWPAALAMLAYAATIEVVVKVTTD